MGSNFKVGKRRAKLKIQRFLYNDKVFYGMPDGDKVRIIQGDIYSTYTVSDIFCKTSDVKILPPCTPSKIVCVGLNYRDHQLEMNEFADDFPKLFIKPSTSMIAHDEYIVNPPDVNRVDFEAELAVIIKKKAKNIKKGTARDYILGYTCFNDVTAREIQKKDVQWTRAKSYDTFAPIGPVIATDINPGNLDIKLLLNGNVKQHSNTSKFIWGVDFLVEEISKIMTLLPGDVISTGTPAGCGKMEKGDRAEVVIENIGTLTNYFAGG
jgi:2-keto-4-pentenoate hydratase/2-oxohepta-3-ene-1,7-dioic acid hydratase in catechol pathway